MTPKELKAWRIKVCTDLANGVQYQLQVTNCWCDQPPATVAANLFSNDWKPECIRRKPEPRKCWVGWPKNRDAGYGLYWMRPGDLRREDVEESQSYNWQLVEEQA